MEMKETITTAATAVTDAVTETKKIWKAVFLGLTALLTGLAVVTVGDAGLSGVNTSQVLVIAGSVLAAVGGVFGFASGD